MQTDPKANLESHQKDCLSEAGLGSSAGESIDSTHFAAGEGIEVMTPDMAFDSPDIGIAVDSPSAADALSTEMEPVLSFEGLVSAIEALLFVADRPVSLDRMKKIIATKDTENLKKALAQLREDLTVDCKRGLFLADVAGGYQLRTKQENAPWIRKFVDTKPVRLGPAAMEVLSIIAYRQPITRSGVEDIRGVDCGQVVRTLLDRKLVKMIGKVEEPGRPILYGTTKYFLEVFGIQSLNDLPPLKEFQEISPEESERIQSFLGPQSDLQETEQNSEDDANLSAGHTEEN